jgi:hypothetical protein
MAEDTIEPYVETVSGWFDNLSPALGDLVDTSWAMFDYALVEVVFAYLDGSLTADTDYAWITYRLNHRFIIKINNLSDIKWSKLEKTSFN